MMERVRNIARQCPLAALLIDGTTLGQWEPLDYDKTQVFDCAPPQTVTI